VDGHRPAGGGADHLTVAVDATSALAAGRFTEVGRAGRSRFGSPSFSRAREGLSWRKPFTGAASFGARKYPGDTS